MTLAIRASSSGHAAAQTFTITLPAGSVAGDLCMLFCGAGWSFSSMVGWVEIDARTAGSWNGFVCWKVLTPADITAGTAAVVLGGSGASAWAAVTLVGSGAPRVGAYSIGSTASPVSLASNADVLTGDTVLLFGANGASSTNTINQGTQVTAVNNNASASCSLNSLTAAASGSFTAAFTYPTAGSGNYQAIISVIEEAAISVSQLEYGAAVALSQNQEQVTRLEVGAAVALSQNQEQVTRLEIGVLVDITARDHSQAILGLGAWGM